MIEQTARIISELVDQDWSVSFEPEMAFGGLAVLKVSVERGGILLSGMGANIDMATADLVGQIRRLMQQLQEVSRVD